MTKLTQIEIAALEYFLINKCGFISNREDFFDDIVTPDRFLSGIGFITDLPQADKLKFFDETVSKIDSSVGAILNKSIDTGYLVYIKNGYITGVEGFTYGEEWPSKISDIEFYTPDFSHNS